MIWTALALAILGLALSALFSGTETGFYRAGRMRLVLDAWGGDWIARVLLWLTNRPFIYVATVLAGNNLANYLVSMSIVLAAASLFSGPSELAEFAMPLVLTPVLFVYGELLPKNLFLHAPNRLLRRAAPLFLVFVVVFFPVSLLLWAFNKLIERLTRHTPQRVQLTLARRELHRVLDEGHDVGILRPSQRALAQGILASAARPVGDVVTPLADVPRARQDMTRDEVLGIARRYRIPAVCVEEPGPQRRLIGYVRVIDLAIAPSDSVGPVRPLRAPPRPRYAPRCRHAPAERTREPRPGRRRRGKDDRNRHRQPAPRAAVSRGQVAAPALLAVAQHLHHRQHLLVGDKPAAMPNLIAVDGHCQFLGLRRQTVVAVAELTPLRVRRTDSHIVIATVHERRRL